MSVALDTDDFPPLPSQKAKQQSKRKKTKLPAKLNLLDLPNELLMEIFEYVLPKDFHRPDDIQLAAILALVNKRFSEIIRQRYHSGMYRSYDIRTGIPILFLRTMTTRPRIAAQLRKLSCLSRGVFYTPKAPYRLSLEDKRIIKSGFKALGIPHWKEWASSCITEEVDDQDLCAAIMMHAPNLTTLRVVEGNAYGVPPWLKLLKQIISGTPFGRASTLSRLEEVKVELRRNDLQLHELIHVFRVPTLKSVTFWGLVATDPNPLEHDDNPPIPWWLLKAPNPPNSIQKLCLLNCYIEVDTLVRLVRSCAALNTFWMRQDTYPEQMGDPSPEIYMHYDRLDHALTQHCATLEHVYVEETVSDFATEPERRSRSLFRSFSKMQKLTVLSLPLSALVDRRNPDTSAEHSASSLPPSLVEFRVNNIYRGLDRCLSCILRHTLACVRDGCLARLNTIRLQGANSLQDKVEHMVEGKYREECSEHHLKLCIEQENDYEWDTISDDDSVTDSET